MPCDCPGYDGFVCMLSTLLAAVQFPEAHQYKLVRHAHPGVGPVCSSTFAFSVCRLPNAMKPIINQFNVTAIKELYSTVDMIGISSYAALKAEFKLADLEDAIRQFDEELKQFGPDLKDVSCCWLLCFADHVGNCCFPCAICIPSVCCAVACTVQCT